MSFRFNIVALLTLTGVVAVLVALELHGIALALCLFLFLPLALLGFIVHLVFRLQRFTANWLTPYFYSRGMINPIRLICGRTHSAWALNNYGAKLTLGRHYDSAVAAFSRALELDDAPPAYWINRGWAKSRIGQLESAIEDLTVALNLDENSPVALAHRGFAYFEMGDLRSALKDFECFECNTPEHYELTLCRGHIHEQLQAWQDAMNDYLLAYDLDASRTSAGVHLARLQAGCPDSNFRDGQKAIENSTNMCVRSSWNDWASVSVLAAAYAEIGDFSNALKYANVALELAPEEEKTERKNRIEQFQKGLPFRLPEKG